VYPTRLEAVLIATSRFAGGVYAGTRIDEFKDGPEDRSESQK
jgi:hypothetical protein